MTAIRRFWGDRKGATAIEYGLMTALIAVAVLASVTLIGEPVEGLFGGIATEFNAVNQRL